MPIRPGLLARGPWDPEQLAVSWRSDPFEPDASAAAAADAAVDALRDRGSPSHDGLAARMVSFAERDGRLELELQPVRWALRLTPEDAAQSLSVLCLVRDPEGRWLAGLRAAWLASWTGRWALGAAGSVEVGENPAETLRRELKEEWGVAPERLSVEALVRLPNGIVHVIGQARVAAGATISPNDEHDEFAWWPAEVEQWPEEADEPLRRLASLLAAG